MLIALGVSSFVFLFLYIFKPFNLGTYPGSVFLFTLGYGLATFLVMLIFNVIMLFSFRNYFNEPNWTTSKELLWLLILLFFIGLANTLYTMLAGVGGFHLKTILYFELYTILIGFFPISASILINYYRLISGYEKGSNEINKRLKEHLSGEHSISGNPDLSTKSVTLIAENGKDEFTFAVKSIVFIRSADNYAEIFFIDDHAKLTCQLIRITLKKCEEELQTYHQFFRCHKSFLVNLQKVSKVTGNAQGYKLHVENAEELIPVSRIHNKTIKDKLAEHKEN